MITPTKVFADQSDTNRYFIEFPTPIRHLDDGEILDIATLGRCRVDSADWSAAHVTLLPVVSRGTHLGIVLDETGSMGNCVQRTLSALNEYLATLRSHTQQRYRVTLATFSSQGTHGMPQVQGAASFAPNIRYKYRAQDLREIGPFSDYHPGGGTPLYDAVADMIHQLEATKGNDLAILVVLTDGEENASTIYSQAAIQALVRQKQAEGWAVVFLGADLSREQVERATMAMGMNTANSMSYGKAAMQGSFQHLGRATQGYTVSAGASANNVFNRATGATGAATIEELERLKAKELNEHPKPPQQQQGKDQLS